MVREREEIDVRGERRERGEWRMRRMEKEENGERGEWRKRRMEKEENGERG